MYDFFDERKCFLNIKVGHITKLIFYLFLKNDRICRIKKIEKMYIHLYQTRATLKNNRNEKRKKKSCEKQRNNANETENN